MHRPAVIHLLLTCLMATVVAANASADTSDSVYQDPFTLPIKIRIAQQLFEARRFRDAERMFLKLEEVLKPALDQNLSDYFDSYVSVLDYLAQSRSQQGKTERVVALMAERHRLIETTYDENGFQFATSLSRVAEAHYREGNSERAITLVVQAIDIYQQLNPTPQAALDRSQKNLIQYRVAPFSSAMLPMDLSDFYSRCDLINHGDSNAATDKLMAAYIEVGIDYIPEGTWREFFDILKYPAVSDYDGGSERRVFIPDTSEPMRDEFCSVNVKSGIVVSAESAVE